MVLAVLQGLLGEWGRAVLYFYLANSLWINLIVVAYGVLIVLSWVNLKNIRNSLVWSLVDQLKSQVEVISGKLAKKEKASLVVPWESAVGKSRFPLVAFQSALVPHRLSIKRVQAMLPMEDLVNDALRILELQKQKKTRK